MEDGIVEGWNIGRIERWKKKSKIWNSFFIALFGIMWYFATDKQCYVLLY